MNVVVRHEIYLRFDLRGLTAETKLERVVRLVSGQKHDAAHDVIADVIGPATVFVVALGFETELVEVAESVKEVAGLRWLGLSSGWKLKLLPFEQGLWVQISSRICLSEVKRLA